MTRGIEGKKIEIHCPCDRILEQGRPKRRQIGEHSQLISSNRVQLFHRVTVINRRNLGNLQVGHHLERKIPRLSQLFGKQSRGNESEGGGGNRWANITQRQKETSFDFVVLGVLVDRRWRFEDVWVRNFFNCVYYSYFFAVVIARYDTTKNRTDKFSFAVH